MLCFSVPYTSSEIRCVERNLGDLMSFISCLSYNPTLGPLLASHRWTQSFLTIVGVESTGVPRIEALAPRLLALELLSHVLPKRDIGSERRQQVFYNYFSTLY